MQIHRHYCKDLYGEAGEYRNSDGSPLSKTMFYTKYLKDLDIEPSKDDQNLAFVTHEEKQLLDRYHSARLAGKAALQAFLTELKGAIVPSEVKVSPVLERSETNPNAITITVMPPEPSPIAKLRERIELLSDLCDRQILIPTSDVKLLLDRKSISGSELSAYGFSVIRTDLSQSGQSLWKVKRAS